MCASLPRPLIRDSETLKFLSTDDILKVKIKLQTLALDARRVRVREEPDSPSGQLDHSRGQKPKSVLDTLLGSDEEMEDDDPAHDQREDAVRNEVLLYFEGESHSKGQKPTPMVERK
ncbi:hypothetical protein CgunFtcFv8_003414 [Champsocephalus gunnari]|uniref:Uncharacterized protein n=1 Tax=Champsocephalus gunnari TaxID=52237 RepID=A0AAN8D8C6_CHAGU|nr:hypothetical protein CgunFtcFv8_003414 [Champsocephalus gunnari]